MSERMAVERLRKLAAIDDYPLRVVGADDLRTLLTEHDALLRRAEEAEAYAGKLREALKRQESALCIIRDRQSGRIGEKDLERGIALIREALSLTPSVPEQLT